MNEPEDKRWPLLAANRWKCGNCDDWHEGLPDLGSDFPDPWTGDSNPGSNSLALHSTHFLSEDFCVIEDQDFFVRCVLRIPLIGSGGDQFAYGVWSSLSRKNFESYRDNFKSGNGSGIGPWFGWFSSRLKGYPDCFSLKCRVHPQADGERPLIELEATDHPLAVEQRTGITFERMIEIYALNGHQPHVTPGS